MKKQTNILDEETIYVYARFKIKQKVVEKLIEFLKTNTKTFDCWWKNKIGEPEDEIK